MSSICITSKLFIIEQSQRVVNRYNIFPVRVLTETYVRTVKTGSITVQC